MFEELTDEELQAERYKASAEKDALRERLLALKTEADRRVAVEFFNDLPEAKRLAIIGVAAQGGAS